MSTIPKTFDPSRIYEKTASSYIYDLPAGHTLEDTLIEGYFIPDGLKNFMPFCGTAIIIGRRKTFIGFLEVTSTTNPEGRPITVKSVTTGVRFDVGKELIEACGTGF